MRKSPENGPCVWAETAQEWQLEPDGYWRYWLCMSDRGEGKSRAGSEWIRSLAMKGLKSFGIVFPDSATAMHGAEISGSGLLDVCHADDRTESGILLGKPVYNRMGRIAIWQNGAFCRIYSACEPDSHRLRANSHDAILAEDVDLWQDYRSWPHITRNHSLDITAHPKVWPYLPKNNAVYHKVMVTSDHRYCDLTEHLIGDLRHCEVTHSDSINVDRPPWPA